GLTRPAQEAAEGGRLAVLHPGTEEHSQAAHGRAGVCGGCAEHHTHDRQRGTAAGDHRYQHHDRADADAQRLILLAETGLRPFQRTYAAALIGGRQKAWFLPAPPAHSAAAVAYGPGEFDPVTTRRRAR